MAILEPRYVLAYMQEMIVISFEVSRSLSLRSPSYATRPSYKTAMKAETRNATVTTYTRLQANHKRLNVFEWDRTCHLRTSDRYQI